MTHIELPLTKQTIHVETIINKQAVDHQVYEGEAKMTQQQQDFYKSLVGDGNAKVTISREASESQYGTGGRVFVSVTLTCDQSQQAVNAAIGLAHQIADGAVWHYHEELRQQCYAKGLLKPPQAGY